jgi:hypothetical protein
MLLFFHASRGVSLATTSDMKFAADGWKSGEQEISMRMCALY